MFKSSPLNLANYSITKTLGQSSRNSVLFEVTKAQRQADSFIAEVYQLNTCISLQILMELFKEGEAQGTIEEIIYFTKNERCYLAVIRRKQNTIFEKPILDNLLIFRATCKRLIQEAIALVKKLHQLGLYLKCPLDIFLQVDKQQLNIPQIRIFTDQFFPNQKIQDINKEESLLLYNFCSKLSTLIKPTGKFSLRQLQLDTFFECLNQDSPQNDKNKMEELQNILCEFVINHEDFRLYCRLEDKQNHSLMFIELEDKKTKKSSQFYLKSAVKIKQKNKFILVRDLFFVLSSRFPQEVRPCQNNWVYYWDQQLEQWNLIKLKKQNQGYQIDEDQNGQAKDLKQQWSQEVSCSQNKNIKGEDKKQANLPVEKKLIQHPYNKIVQIKSSIVFENGSTTQIEGVGFLIRQQLVVTCAHNLFCKYDRNLKKQAKEADIYIPCKGWQKIQNRQWYHPEQYWQKNDKRFDFTLILLTQFVTGQKQDLTLAYDYSQVDRVLMAKVKANQKESIHLSLQQMNLSRREVEGMIRHKMRTNKGDSGTPFLVQPKGMYRACYVIGMHRSGQYIAGEKVSNKAIKFTKQVIDKLGQFEKKICKHSVSTIQFTSINFDKIKSRPKQYMDVIWTIKKIVGQNFTLESLLSNQRLKQMSKQKEQLRIGAQKYIDLSLSEGHLYRSCFGANDRKKYQSLMKGQHWQTISTSFRKYFTYQEKDYLFNTIKFILYISYNMPKVMPMQGPFNKTVQWCQIQQMEKVQCKIERQPKWDAFVYIISNKKCGGSQLTPPLKGYYYTLEAAQIIQKLHKLIGLKYKIDENYKLRSAQMLVKYQQLYKVTGYFTKQPSKKKFPFASVQQSLFYSATKDYQYQLRVDFRDRQLRNKIFWQLHNIDHKYFVCLPLSRRNVPPKKGAAIYSLKMVMIKGGFVRFDQVLSLLPISWWLGLMIQMTEFIAYLHEDQKSLCTKIENSMLICILDPKKLFPIFYYCQSLAALQHQYLLLTKEEQKLQSQYIPKDEVLNNRSDPNKVDVWILGKTFQRLVRRWHSNTSLNNNAKQSMKGIINSMITEAQYRPTMKDVLSRLRQIKNNYKKK